MKKLTLIGAAAMLALSSHAHSAEEAAGCGIGAQVFDGQSGKGTNIVAGILNVILIPNTFFITTGGGLLGCDPTQTVQRDELTEIFVAQNMDQLTTETAKGSGEYLNVLAALLGVPESEVPRFTDLAQAEFDTLFTEGNNAASVIASLQLAMANDQHLSQFSADSLAVN